MKNTYLLFIALLLFILAMFQFSQLNLQNKRMDCINHGFFDYSEKSNTCWSLYGGTEASYSDVMNNKVWGDHCYIIKECIKLKGEN